jgi:RNA polymerase sigma-70 factor (ECF subfamily)
MPDDPEFLQLFMTHQDGLRAYIRSMIREPGLADDVFQETSIVLWKEFARFDRARSFGAWARGIASHKVLKAYGQVRRRGIPLTPEAIAAITTAFDEREDVLEAERLALRSCLARLSVYGRQLLTLRYEESLPLSQLAERVGRTEEAVHKALVRVRAALGKCVDLSVRANEGAP